MELRLQYWPKRMGPALELWAAAYDIRSMFKGRIVYKLPFGKGAQFLNSNSILDEVIGGWQTAATVQWQSGNRSLLRNGITGIPTLRGRLVCQRSSGVNPYAGAAKWAQRELVQRECLQ